MANRHVTIDRPLKSDDARTVRRGADVQEFLDQLAAALRAGDATKIASLWGLPAGIFGDRGDLTLYKRDDLERFFARAIAEHTTRGLVATAPELLSEQWLSHRVVMLKMRWPYVDVEGREVGSEVSDYTLRRDDLGRLEIRALLVRTHAPTMN
ncbi:MAG TPA: hypothetical protein VFQ53_39030 [Kofleriaceae bacterium]|nr:hypothetical protein [Kofleriaceae bacterium]